MVPMVPVVQNITYNTAIVYPPPPAPPPRTAPTLSFPRDPAPQAAQAAVPPIPSSPRAGLVSTGVLACDAYLARLELCTGRMLRGRNEAPYGRMLETFDLMRRNWRRAAQTAPGRDTLVDSCETSLRTYDQSVGDSCR